MRRYYKCMCDQKVSGVVKQDRFKLELLMNQAGIAPGEREVEKKAAACSEAIDGARRLPLSWPTAASSPAKPARCGRGILGLLNALKRLAGIDQEIDLVSSKAIEPIQQLKTTYLGSKNPRLHTDEILIALSSSATRTPSPPRRCGNCPNCAAVTSTPRSSCPAWTSTR